jgi:hypothetical protein
LPCELATGDQSCVEELITDLKPKAYRRDVTAEERALNFAASNAFQVSQVMESAAHGDLELDTVSVRKSPVCRPDSDCHDIEIRFFDPRDTRIADKVYRFTVDVSDVMPVTIGEVRAWRKRA